MAAVVSGTAYDVKTAASVPEDWTANGDYSTSGGGFFKITESTSYLQTDEFCQNGISSIVIKARKFGTVTGGKEVLTIEWIETGSDTPVELGTVSPTSTSLNNCELSNPASIAGNKSGVIKIYSKNASSGGGAGVQTVTITYTSGTCGAIEPHTVSFSTGAGNPAVEAITETEGGAGITLPAGPAPTCTNWAFAGWATAAVAAETTTAPTLLAAGATYKPAEDVTLYAVYKRTEESGEIGFVKYEKVTEDPEDWSGIYLLAANTSGDIYYTFTGQNGTNSYGASENYTPGTTEKTDWEVTIAKTTNGYSIYHTSSGKYLGLTGSGNNLNFNASFSANNYEWVLSAANGAQSYAYNTRFIECNTSSSYRVACYTSSQKRFYLYKRIEDAIATYYYISAPTCEPVVEPTTKTIYCSPFSGWHNDGARFAVHALGDGENTAWYDLVAVEGAENVYSAEIAEAFPTVIFCRMNGETTENNWDNKWNQTADLTLPTDGKNLYTITGWNPDDGTWSVYGEEPVVVEHTYTVAGSSAILGVNWDPAAAANDMTFNEESELYELEIAEVELNAGNYEYKVAIDHAWENGEAVDNSTIEIAKSGKYKVTFTYNAGVAVTEAVATLLEEVEIDPTAELGIGIWGNDADWAQTNMALAADKASASYTVAIEEAGDYRFKLVINSNWRSNGYEYHRGYTGAAGINSNAADMKLTADVAGDYIFTWFFENDSIAITFPAAPVYTLENGYYLLGTINEWTPAAAYKFAVNPNSGDVEEYVLTATLAENQAFKVVYVENDAIKTYYPEGTDNDYVVDAAHAGVKDIYFRPDGQGGDDWYEHCIFIAANEAPVVVELQAVSEATTWDFSKITANTENALYNNEGIQLTDESTPSKNDEMVYANYSADFMTFAEGFDAATMAFKGEYPIRKNQYCQAGTLRFKTTVAGTITVKFSDTGSKASTTAVKRYLVVNGEQTEYWTSRGNNGTTDPHDQQLNVETQAIAVPAGDVTITGSSAIVVSNVTFTPSEEPVVVEHTYTVAGSSAILGVNWDPAAAANDMTFNEESELYELEIAEVELNAGNYEYKVAIDHAWENGEAVDNSTIEIAKSGKYKVTFTYNAGVAVTEAVATLLEEVEIDPTAELGIGIWGNDADWAQTNMALAADKASASYTVAIEEAGDYRFKLVINSNWRSNGYEYHRGYTGAAGINSNAADMKLTADVAGDYIFTWFFENDSIAITFPAAPVYTLENGYYLLGTINEWTPAAAYKFAVNPNSGDVEEYVLTATLAENQAFKVVYVENDAIKTYYPEGTDNDYVVDAAHVGETDIYFRPNYNGSEDWHNNCIFVAPTSGTAIDEVAGEAKAVKILKNGMLIIEKNGVKYNVLGVRL